MCGRFQLQLDAPQIASLYPGAVWRAGHATRHTPRNQVRPTTPAPVLIQHHPALSAPSSAPSSAPTADIVMMNWGFQPPVSARKQAAPGHGRSLINARCETLLQLATFRRLLTPNVNARCAVPATGFYEWYKPRGGRSRDSQPFLIQRDKLKPEGDGKGGGPVMFMAGLYDPRAESESGDAAFVIITAAACKEFAWLHDRQPCFLDSHEEVGQWLQCGTFPSEQVVPRLLTCRESLSWKRMVRDLSSVCEDQTKPKAQTEITSFFTLKPARGNDKAGKSGEKPQTLQQSAGGNLGVARSPQSLKKTTPRRHSKKKGPR